MSLEPISRTSRRAGTIVAAALSALAVAALAAPSAGAAPARYESASADGSVVFFTSTDPLVSGDADSRRDVFERSQDAAVGGEYVTRQVSLGPTGGNQAHDANYVASSADGSRVFFSTQESLVPADADASVDIYMRDLEENTTTLVSRGDPSCSGSCGNGGQSASFVAGGLADGGNRIFFATAEKLSEADGDSASDVYRRDVAAGTTVLVSAGDASCAPGCGNGPSPAFFADASADGTKAVLTSVEALVAGDANGRDDLYQRDLDSGTTERVSIAGTCPEGLDCSPVYGGASSDGSHVFFETKEQIAGGDTDESADVYDWSGGAATLASTGPDGGNGPHHVTYAGSTADGEAVFFQTDEKLVLPDDEDAVQDVYVRSAGTATSLVSTGPQAGTASPATLRRVVGSGADPVAFFITGESLVAEDTDGQQDLYQRSAGSTTLLSRGSASCEEAGCGNGPHNANFADASSDGTHVLFVTEEPLAGADGDTVQDIYERSGGVTGLVSTGTHGGSGAFPTKRVAIAGDGSKVFFETSERLTVDDDFLEEDDVYSRAEAGTLLESVGNDPNLEIGPPAPKLEATDPASPGESTEPRIVGQAAAGTEVKLYRTADCSGEQALDPAGEPAGGSGEELAAPGIAVAAGAGATTTFYASAEAEGIVSPCSGGISYTQEAAKEEEGGGGEEGGEEESSPPPPPPPAPPPPPPSEGGTSTGGGGSATLPQFHSGGISFVTPETRISFGPSFKTRKRRAVFRFHDATGQPATRFICKLDRRRWHRCDSPKRLRKLRPGRHVFKVKAVNAAGMWEAGNTKRRFKVVGGRCKKRDARCKRRQARAKRRASRRAGSRR